MTNNQWNQILSLLANLYNETQDDRLAGLHAMVVGYALKDHERNTGFNYNSKGI